MRRLTILLAVLAAACDPSVAPKNPYDPATPPELQAKSALRGRLKTSLVSSLAGQQVALRRDGLPVSPTTCATDGAFVFSGLTPGQYQLATSPTGFAPLSLSAALHPGQDLDMGEIDLTPLTGAQGALITGRVSLEGSLGDLSGTLVEAVGAAFTAVTDSQGAFRLNLIPGTYSLQFTHPAFKTQRVDSVAVASGETQALPDDVLLLINPAHVIGHVDGEVLGGPAGPLSTAVISVDGQTGSATTGPSGDFQLDVPAGSYVLRVRKIGYADATMPVLNLVGGEDRPVGGFTLALARGGIAGRVALADGGDPSGAVVEVTGEGRATVAAADGRFALDGLVVGVHEVSARRDGYARAVQGSITVVEGASADAGTLLLARQGGTISVKEAPYAAARLVHLQLSASGVTHYQASEDPAFADAARGDTAATWHAFIAGEQVPFTLGDADGAHTIYVAFSTGGASPSAPLSTSVVLDRQPPATPAVVVGDGSGWSRAASGVVSLVVSAQDLPAVAGAEASGLGKLQVVNGADFGAGGVSTVDFNTTLSWPLAQPGTDGVKTVSVRVIDRAGNVSAAGSATATVDTLPPAAPSLALAGPDATRPGFTTTPFVSAVVSASDLWGGAGNQNLYVALSNDQGFLGARYQPFAPEIPWVLASGDGQKKVWARFMDPAGNESLPVEATISLTTSGPSGPALAIIEGDSRQNGATNQRAITLRLDAVGQAVLARVAENPALTGATDVSLAGVSLPYVTPAALGLELADADGPHTLWVRFYDAAGNASELAAAAVTLDRTAPSAVAPTVSPAPWAPSAAVTLTAPAAGQDEVQVSGVGVLTPVGWQAAPAGATLALGLGAGDGAKLFTVSYRDLADNLTTLPAPAVALAVDATPPTAPPAFAVHGTLADATASTALTATTAVTLDLSGAADGAGSGVQEMQLGESASLAGAPWVAWAPGAPFQLTSGDGTKTVYARFRDGAGHVSGTVSGTILLDTTAPASPALTVVESDARQNGVTSQAAVSFTFSAAGSPALALVADNAAFTGAKAVALTGQPLPYSTAVGGLALAGPDGVKTFYVRYLDAAANASAVATASVTLDTVPPAAVAPTASATGFTRSTSLTLTIPSAGQDEVQVTGPGLAAPVAWTAAASGAVVPLTLADLDGAKAFTVAYRDLADHVTTLPATSLTLDTAVPTAADFAVRGALADGTASTSLTTTAAVTLDLSAASDGSGSGLEALQVSEDAAFAGAAWNPHSASVPFTLSSGDGPKVVYARFRDRLGQVSAAVRGGITLDAAGPAAASVGLVESDSRPANGFTNATGLRLVLNASGSPVRALASENPSFGAGSVSIDLAGQVLPYTTSSGAFSLAGSDGVHTVWVKFFDAAGNASNPATAQVALDRVAPSATAPILSPAASAKTTAATLTPPSAGQDELQVTGAGVTAIPWTAAPAGVAIPLTLVAGDGAKAFTVTWRDLADNQSAPLPLSLTLDAGAPVVPASVAITGTLGDGSTSTAFTASTGVTLDLRTGFSDATSGLAEVMISNRSDFSDASWQPYVPSAQVPWTLLPGDGPPAKTVYVKVRDAAGTASGAVTGSLDLRATPPSAGSIVVAGGATDTSSASPVAAISASGAAQMLVAVNGTTVTGGTGGWVAYGTSLPLAFSAPGVQAVTVRFRNAARVEGGGASATIAFDQAAPAAADVKMVGTRGDGLTDLTGTWATQNAVSVTIPGTAGAVIEPDVTAMLVYQSTGSSSCTAPVTATWQPYVATSTLLLSGADGAKRVCAQVRDRAGNIGAAGFQAIGLDTTAPTNPAFTDLATTTTSATTATGHLVVASSDPAPGSAAATYQCYASPASPKWTDCAPGPGLAFTFALTANAPNVVGVRARDDARNASSGTLVSVLQDSVKPLPPNISELQSTSDSITLAWDASPDTDVASYRVYYGNFAGDLSGTGAAQGASPVTVTATGQGTQSFTLTGLTTSYPYYLAVEAVDRAGNASGPSGQRFVQPNAVNPRLLSTIGGQPRSVGVRIGGAKAYAYELQNQSVVQLDVSDETALPGVTGRASLPNFVPDERAEVVVFDCQHTGRQGLQSGHCVVAAGSTLEGDYRGDDDAYRAPAPVVFFPVDPGGPGTVVSVLPARPFRVVSTRVAGKLVLLTVERGGVKAFDPSTPRAPKLLASTALDLQRVVAAGEAWGTSGQALQVYGPIRTGRLPDDPPALYEFTLANVWSGSLPRVDHGWLEDPNGWIMGASIPTIVPFFGDNQFYVAWADASGTWIGEWSPGWPRPWDWQLLADSSLVDTAPVAGAAGNMHVYVFCRPPGAMADPGPYAHQLFSDGGMTKTAEVWDLPSEPVGATVAVFPAGNTTDTEHLLVVDRAAATYTLQRWHVNGGTTPFDSAVTYNPGSFREVDPTWFAESDRFLFVSQGERIFTIDVANPLFPQVAQTFSSADFPVFQKLLVHGRYLYAANQYGTYGAGVYVFRIDGKGKLTQVSRVSAPSMGSFDDFTVRGKYLYLTYGPVRAIDMANPAAPGATVTSADVACHALDVRPGVVSGTVYEGLIGCAEWGAYPAADRFQLLTFNGATIASAAAAVALPWNLGSWNKYSVTLGGGEAVVGNHLGSVVVNVASPTSPWVDTAPMALTGRVLFQGGYHVGLGKTGAASGPDFLGGAGNVDGTLLFSTCAGAGSLASVDGVYYASCGRNGISIFAAPARGGGTQLKRADLSSSWSFNGGAALAMDGSFSYLAGPSVVSDYGRLYSVDERGNATAAPQGPSYWSGNTLGSYTPAWFLLQDGNLISFEGFYNGSSPSLRVLLPSDPYSVWPTRGAYTLPFRVGFGSGVTKAQPVGDGEYVYASVSQTLPAASTTSDLVIYDFRVPSALSGAYGWTARYASAGVKRALALSRDRLYAGAEAGNAVEVYDTAGNGLAKLTSLTLRAAVTSISGLAAQGRWLFVTYEVGEVQPYGLSVYQLDPTTRAGAGATLVADFASSVPLTSPTVVGDTLYVTRNLGVATWDLLPLWQDGKAPVALGASAILGPLGGRTRFIVDGPFAYLVGGTYIAFDLRQ